MTPFARLDYETACMGRFADKGERTADWMVV